MQENASFVLVLAQCMPRRRCGTHVIVMHHHQCTEHSTTQNTYEVLLGTLWRALLLISKPLVPAGWSTFHLQVDMSSRFKMRRPVCLGYCWILEHATRVPPFAYHFRRPSHAKVEAVGRSGKAVVRAHKTTCTDCSMHCVTQTPASALFSPQSLCRRTVSRRPRSTPRDTCPSARGATRRSSSRLDSSRN